MFPPKSIRRTGPKFLFCLVLLRWLAGSFMAAGVASLLGVAGLRVLNKVNPAPRLDLTYTQLMEVLERSLLLHEAMPDIVSGDSVFKRDRNKVAQRMDHGIFGRSLRTIYDIGGGGKPRPGLGRRQCCWEAVQELAKTDGNAQKLVAFVEELRAYISRRCGREVEVSGATAISTLNDGDTALHGDGARFDLRTITCLMLAYGTPAYVPKCVSFGLVRDREWETRGLGRGSFHGLEGMKAAWDYLGDIVVHHGETYGGDVYAMGGWAIGRFLAVAHRVNPTVGCHWSIVIDWKFVE
ncbi:unnamed protein product [Pelagomonas calceolata]|uniref:Uncharacterized protein n=1 Tax=Pelagomonas calceolata TaxID=35677 RepID=A0A8J2SHT7_9STRA|nr:unnamed protein product [Pelagomonas calceolata]